ncbi:MAG: hypothetical protein E7655_05600 [Ruminococcaceae bacterium]|nr:hypothetical protein [Oscillospiraceae bacterium]
MKKRVIVLLAVCGLLLASAAVLGVVSDRIFEEKNRSPYPPYAGAFAFSQNRPPYNPLIVVCTAELAFDGKSHTLSGKEASSLGQAMTESVALYVLSERPTCGFEESESVLLTLDGGTDAEAVFVFAADGCPIVYHKEADAFYGMTDGSVSCFNRIAEAYGIDLRLKKPGRESEASLKQYSYSATSP